MNPSSERMRELRELFREQGIQIDPAKIGVYSLAGNERYEALKAAIRAGTYKPEDWR